jgi:hypothetical protein
MSFFVTNSLNDPLFFQRCINFPIGIAPSKETNEDFFYEILGFHGGEVSNRGLLGGETM